MVSVLELRHRSGEPPFGGVYPQPKLFRSTVAAMIRSDEEF